MIVVIITLLAIGLRVAFGSAFSYFVVHLLSSEFLCFSSDRVNVCHRFPYDLNKYFACLQSMSDAVRCLPSSSQTAVVQSFRSCFHLVEESGGESHEFHCNYVFICRFNQFLVLTIRPRGMRFMPSLKAPVNWCHSWPTRCSVHGSSSSKPAHLCVHVTSIRCAILWYGGEREQGKKSRK